MNLLSASAPQLRDLFVQKPDYKKTKKVIAPLVNTYFAG